MINKLKLISIKNPRDFIFYFIFPKDKDANVNICGLLESLGFTKKESSEFDSNYPEIYEGYLYGESKEIKAHLFISDTNLHMVLDTKISREKILESLKKYFTLPW